MSKWIIVVDDDMANLKMAGHILSKNNMRVSALRSGKKLVEYIEENGAPDLILLDIMMPELDGFETLKLLRQKEKEMGISETPVIFLTADEESATESRGFEVGVSDFIRKPFNPDVLLRRIDNIVSNKEKMSNLRTEASIDKLTGCLNKAATGVALAKICSEETGALLMIDLDSFKLVNDIYGHEMGDRVLIAFSGIVKRNITEGSTIGRIGGDEFVAFMNKVSSESEIKGYTEKLNLELLKEAKEMMGEDMEIPLGVSVGAVFIPKQGNDYNTLLKSADKALYHVKKNGKHSAGIYQADAFTDDEMNNSGMNLETISEILGERSIPNVALQLDKEAFSYVYKYVMRYVLRYHIGACKVLFTLNIKDGVTDEEYKDQCDEFGNHIRQSLRKTDVIMRGRYNQYFVLLTDIKEDFKDNVINQIKNKWYDKFEKGLDIVTQDEMVMK